MASSDPLLIVVAEIVAKPGLEEKVRETLLNLIPTTRQEEGCVQYDLHVSTDEPARFVFFEKWTSREMLDRHLAAPHLVAFAGAAPDLLAEPVRILTAHQIG